MKHQMLSGMNVQGPRKRFVVTGIAVLVLVPSCGDPWSLGHSFLHRRSVVGVVVARYMIVSPAG